MSNSLVGMDDIQRTFTLPKQFDMECGCALSYNTWNVDVPLAITHGIGTLHDLLCGFK